MASKTKYSVALNHVCAYFTMYPLDFPLRILSRHASTGQWVLDPFCGRGTTNFAARLLGLPSVGIDSSPIAAALAQAKLAASTAGRVVAAAQRILLDDRQCEMPCGEFWAAAYHPDTLRDLCWLRAALRRACSSPTHVLLRAILLGALHGPMTKSAPSHFSNQCPRTFAPKPAYAVKFWRQRGLTPPRVNVLDVVKRRAERYLSGLPPAVDGFVTLGDSRSADVMGNERRFSWVITSPPYYGMRTYIPDQWLRNWFMGGPSEVPYAIKDQVLHQSPQVFVNDLASVWKNVARVCQDDARLVIRFGGINDRKQEPLELLNQSLRLAGWRMLTCRNAGDAGDGRRQADQFIIARRKPMPEYDVYATLAG